MRTFSSFIAVVFLFTIILSACNFKTDQKANISSPSTSFSNPPKSDSNVASGIASKIELFTMDELFNQGGGGCGMTLWKQEDGLRPPGYLFYNRLAQQAGDEFTLMKIDDEFVRFRHTTATGQEFYGQRTSQTFVSQDGSIQLQVDVTLGEPGEIESFAVEGTIQVRYNNQSIEQSTEIPVRGSAGC